MTPRVPLTVLERAVLKAVMAQDARIQDKTLEGIAARLRGDLGLDAQDVRRAIRELEKRDPPLLWEDEDANLGVRFWRSTDAAAAAMQES